MEASAISRPEQRSQRGHRLFVHNTTVDHVDNVTRLSRRPGVVCHHTYSRTALMELSQQILYRFAVLSVEVAGRLVGGKDRGVTGHGTGYSDCNALQGH